MPTARNSSAPCAMIHVACASVSTLLTSVGLAASPAASPGSASVALHPSCGAVANRPCWNGGRTRGSGSLPSITSSIAFSSPNRYSSGPRAIVTSRSPSRPAAASSRAARSSASHSRTNDAFTPMYTSCAPIVNAAIAAPVTTWYGSRRMIERSLNVPGSPSAPFATTNLRLPRASRTVRHLRPVGKPPPPRPRSPARSSSAMVASGPSSRAWSSARSPSRARKSSSVATGEGGSTRYRRGTLPRSCPRRFRRRVAGARLPMTRSGQRPTMVLRIGTSGWQYRDWRGRFYPPGVPSTRWLEHYAARFATVEVNNTFYRLPAPGTFEQWSRRRAGRLRHRGQGEPIPHALQAIA